MPSRLQPVRCVIAGVEMFRVEHEGDRNSRKGISIEVGRSPAGWPGNEKDLVEKRWAAMVDANPRLYSGPLLSVVSIDAELGVIHTARDEFKRLAVQPQVRTGVQILSVTGAITARDAKGRTHVLLGRRGRTTRVYGGMWELGPAGGIPPPHASVATLTETDAARHLLEEAEEELGLTLESSRIPPVALYIRDTIAHSDDLTFLIAHNEAGSMERLAHDLAARRATHAWEYEETAWVALEDIPSFDANHAEEIIITTRAAFRGFGWMP